MLIGEYGREHFANVAAYLARIGLSSSYLPSLSIVPTKIDGVGSKAFAEARLSAGNGLDTTAVFFFYLDADSKLTKMDIFTDGPTIKYNDFPAFQAAGYAAPPPPPLPAGRCSFPFTACTMFGLPSNTPTELANIANIQAQFEAFASASVQGFDPYFATWHAPDHANITTGGSIGHNDHLTSAPAYVQYIVANSGVVVNFAYDIDEIDAAGDRVYLKGHYTADNVDSYFTWAYDMDPAGSGLSVNALNLNDGIANRNGSPRVVKEHYNVAAARASLDAFSNGARPSHRMTRRLNSTLTCALKLTGDVPGSLAIQLDPSDTPIMVIDQYGHSCCTCRRARVSQPSISHRRFVYRSGGAPKLTVVPDSSRRSFCALHSGARLRARRVRRGARLAPDTLPSALRFPSGLLSTHSHLCVAARVQAGDKVVVTLRLLTDNGINCINYFVFDFEPNSLTSKIKSASLFADSLAIKYNDLALWESAGYSAPPPPPLPASTCRIPFSSACSFGSPSNTPAELANIATALDSWDTFLLVRTQGPAPFFAAFLDPANVNVTFNVATGQFHFSTALDFLQFTANALGYFTNLAFFIDDVDAVVRCPTPNLRRLATSILSLQLS